MLTRVVFSRNATSTSPCYTGQFLAIFSEFTRHLGCLRPMTSSIAFWEGVARKIDDEPVTRINLLKIRHSALRVFEAGSKTRNALPYPEIVFLDLLHVSIFRASAYR